MKKFASQNSELATKHITLRDLTANLLKSEAIDLAANQNAWKDTLRDMRAIVDSVEAECGNTKAWKLHWDRQLLKALGVAYRYRHFYYHTPPLGIEENCQHPKTLLLLRFYHLSGTKLIIFVFSKEQFCYCFSSIFVFY